MTNVLVEGGAKLFGGLLDQNAIDEVHAFVAPVIAGGEAALSPIGGGGIDTMATAMRLERPSIEVIGGDIYLRGIVRRLQSYSA
jgi:diaminohydroxyphosphoribosylaminopyrimidine deaminase/5-amino-6-(5-phosphoribosylamino)uracil reductase